MEDTIYQSGAVPADFSFNAQVAEVFDDMLARSIPYYHTVIDAMAGLVDCRLSEPCSIYDLGCSTGSTLLALSRRLDAKKFHYVGIDLAPAMLEKARNKSAMYGKSEMLDFREADITKCPLPNAGAVLCNYTLQFLRPMLRPAFVRRIHDALMPGGLFLLSEKTISHHSRLNRDFIALYHDFKRQQGYSELEIAAKREALENVLVPFSLQENIDLLEQAGFTEIEPFFKWFNFTSLVAIKN